MNILGLKSNSDSFKKVRLPIRKEKKYPLLEITMDSENQEFTAKMISEDDSNNDEWIVLNDPNFPVNRAFMPGSLFKQFLKKMVKENK